MRVLEVQLRDFRTYARAQASLGESLTVVHGPNGAGKSNLLEALYFGCTGRSTRTRNERELIRFGAQTTRVSVQLSDGGRAHELSVAYGALADGARPIKRMAADGVSVERLLDVAHRPLVSVFAPDRLGLLKGPPSLRRAHLDQLIAAIWPLRADVRRSYARALAQQCAVGARSLWQRAGRRPARLGSRAGHPRGGAARTPGAGGGGAGATTGAARIGARLRWKRAARVPPRHSRER